MWLLSSFNRPGNLKRFFAAFHATGGSTPGMVLIDEGDYYSHAQDYAALDLPLGWYIRKTKARSQGDKIREVWDDIKACAWFGRIGDDNVPETPGWDRRLVDALDGWGIVSCNDGWQAPKRIADCWVMGGDLVRALGYIFAPGMGHLFVDDLWETIGKDADCWSVLMDVKVDHRHVMRGDANVDATHRAAYGDGFSKDHPGPDRQSGSWRSDEVAYRRWLDGDRHRVVALVKANRTPRPKQIDESAAKELYERRLARARSRSVLICTPIARHPTYQYTLALTDTILLLDRLGIAHGRQFVIGSSNLPRARNELVARFLASSFTDLLFVDDDMGWQADAAVRLLACEEPICAAVGRKKVDKPLTDPDMWCGKPDCNKDGSGLTQNDMGFVRFHGVGTGFVKIAREVFEQLIVAHPDWKRAGHNAMSDEVKAKYYRFFFFNDDEWETGEDYTFCASWKKLGGSIWVDPKTELVHVGEKEYRGRISDLMSDAPAVTQREAA